MVFESEKDHDFNALLKLFFFLFVVVNLSRPNRKYVTKRFSVICGSQYQRLIYDSQWVATNDMHAMYLYTTGSRKDRVCIKYVYMSV